MSENFDWYMFARFFICFIFGYVGGLIQGYRWRK